MQQGVALSVQNNQEQATEARLIEPNDLCRTCAKLCRKVGGDLEQVKFLLGHSSADGRTLLTLGTGDRREREPGALSISLSQLRVEL